MNITKLNEIAEKLEIKYLPESAKGNEEAKEILAITQAYRILSVKAETTIDNSGLHLQRVIGSLKAALEVNAGRLCEPLLKANKKPMDDPKAHKALLVMAHLAEIEDYINCL